MNPLCDVDAELQTSSTPNNLWELESVRRKWSSLMHLPPRRCQKNYQPLRWKTDASAHVPTPHPATRTCCLLDEPTNRPSTADSVSWLEQHLAKYPRQPSSPVPTIATPRHQRRQGSGNRSRQRHALRRQLQNNAEPARVWKIEPNGWLSKTANKKHAKKPPRPRTRKIRISPKLSVPRTKYESTLFADGCRARPPRATATVEILAINYGRGHLWRTLIEAENVNKGVRRPHSVV